MPFWALSWAPVYLLDPGGEKDTANRLYERLYSIFEQAMIDGVIRQIGCIKGEVLVLRDDVLTVVACKNLPFADRWKDEIAKIKVRAGKAKTQKPIPKIDEIKFSFPSTDKLHVSLCSNGEAIREVNLRNPSKYVRTLLLLAYSHNQEGALTSDLLEQDHNRGAFKRLRTRLRELRKKLSQELVPIITAGELNKLPPDSQKSFRLRLNVQKVSLPPELKGLDDFKTNSFIGNREQQLETQ